MHYSRVEYTEKAEKKYWSYEDTDYGLNSTLRNAL